MVEVTALSVLDPGGKRAAEERDQARQVRILTEEVVPQT